MERTEQTHVWRLPALIVSAAVTAWLLRSVLGALVTQLAAAGLLMALALPLCRRLEAHMPPSAAAALSLLALGVAAGCLLALLLPPAVRQLQQLSTAFPAMLGWLKEQAQRLSLWLEGHGITAFPGREELFGALTDRLTGLAPKIVSAIRTFIGGLGKVLIAPLLAFYLLRDRKRIASGLTLLLPVRSRARGVRAAREMRRETAAYLRGQLMLSLAVGALTAIGLLLARTPGWLLLGLLMGILELVPYVGPFLAGVPAVLLALQNGIIPAAWTLAVLLVVQQLEGAVLSPRLLGGATRLHPMLVLLMVSAGGMLAGALGMVLAIPAVVSLRGALRGWRT